LQQEYVDISNIDTTVPQVWILIPLPISSQTTSRSTNADQMEQRALPVPADSVLKERIAQNRSVIRRCDMECGNGAAYRRKPPRPRQVPVPSDEENVHAPPRGPCRRTRSPSDGLASTPDHSQVSALRRAHRCSTQKNVYCKRLRKTEAVYPGLERFQQHPSIAYSGAGSTRTTDRLCSPR
jgi:hypothetical protein